ncbi:CoA-binding protein [Saccharopolyspora pogona]|uniref:CoA-binding protein n=1 Tax=Saccharopolyspora pogona TaxID=333966 RepID=UPI001CC23566|nr:CoA-binding protein [Saccharopolyspora pogona]
MTTSSCACCAASRSACYRRDRERVADVASLRRVLCPTSVAVVGASHRESAVGNAMLRNIIQGGNTGTIYAVNRRRGDIHGLTAFRSVADLPEPPEMAVLCVPAESISEVAEECGRRGVRALVVVAAGITGKPAVVDGLLTAVRRWGMRLVGPNCLGVVNSDPAMPRTCSTNCGPRSSCSARDRPSRWIWTP